MANNQNILNTKSFISKDWNGGYKLEIDLTAKTKINNWKFDFNVVSREFPILLKGVGRAV